MTNIVFLEPNKINSEPFTTSDVIAESAGVKHHAIQQLIFKHETDFREFGVFAFEMRKFVRYSDEDQPDEKRTAAQQRKSQALTIMSAKKPPRCYQHRSGQMHKYHSDQL